jgi:hypothetical protein
MCVVCASNHGHHNPITLLLQWWGRSGPCENNHKFSCHGIQALLACVRACMQSYPICTVAVVLDGPVLHCKGSWTPLMHRKGLGFCDLMRLNNTFFLSLIKQHLLGKRSKIRFSQTDLGESADQTSCWVLLVVLDMIYCFWTNIRLKLGLFFSEMEKVQSTIRF